MSAWNENDHPRDGDGKFTDGGGAEYKPKTYRLNTSYADIIAENRKRELLKDGILLPDEQLPRSVGAMWSNFKITMPDGSKARFEEGSRIQNKEIFAGRGCRRKIDDIGRLVNQYGGDPEKWAKVKGLGRLVLDGETFSGEVHWYEEPSAGKVEFKCKEYED